MNPRLTLSLSGSTVTLSFPYDAALVAAVRDVPGRRWNPTQKVWTAPLTAASALVKLIARLPEGVAYDSPATEAAITAAAQAHIQSVAASRATDRTDIDLPAPDGLAYLPYQRAGIAYALNRQSTLFGDEMGLGKTIQAIGVVNADANAKRAVVVCPASLKLNWRREIQKWSTRAPQIVVGNGKDARAWEKIFPTADSSAVEWLIINYDVAKKWHAFLVEANIDVLILDEAHYLKNPKAQRTSYVLGKWNRDPAKLITPLKARRRLALTGTPIPNRPIEAWTLVNALAPDTFKSWKHYATRYCAGYQNSYGWDVTGASNLSELQDKLRGSIMVRRLKADVLAELPPKRRQVIEFPYEGGDAVVNEAAAYARMQEQLEALRAAVELAKASEDQGDYEAAVEALKEGSTAAFTELSKLRHATAVAKLPVVIEHLRDALEETDQKIIVFAHHLDVIKGIRDAFPEISVELTGQTPLVERQAAVDAFQTDAKIRLFVGNLRAAGVGITLTASSTVIFAELDWVPGNITQAEDRAHRIGQRESVLVQHLVLEGSLDAEMARRLVAKQAVLDAALDKEVPDTAAAAIPLLPIRPREEAATEGVSRTQVAEAAVNIKPETVAAVHACLKILAGVCDGAVQRDNAGFNGTDTHIGRRLGHLQQITPRQAVLGQKIIKKYHRQLPAALLKAATVQETT